MALPACDAGEEQNEDDLPTIAPDVSGQFKLKEVNVRSKYQLRVPSLLTSTNDLNPDASLQMQNTFRDMYILIFDEKKEEVLEDLRTYRNYDETVSLLENYRIDKKSNLENNIDNAVISRGRYHKAGDCHAYSLEITGEVDEVEEPISYLMTFIEGEDDLYMVLAWTTRDRLTRFRPMYEASIKTFRELKGYI